MSENNTENKDNIIPLPTEETQNPASEQPKKPQSIQELVASVDLTNVTHHEIIRELVGGIQEVALRATIALGLLERLELQNQANEEAAQAGTTEQ